MKPKLIYVNFILLFIFNSCCFSVKENYLGNNIYLSEYDNVDRRIFYQTESCAESVVEIIPMTILEISHNYEWIIVKSGNKRRKIDFKYWIIKNKYDNLPNSETVIKNTIEFDNFEAFNTFMIDENIDLKLVKID